MSPAAQPSRIFRAPRNCLPVALPLLAVFEPRQDDFAFTNRDKTDRRSLCDERVRWRCSRRPEHFCVSDAGGGRTVAPHGCASAAHCGLHSGHLRDRRTGSLRLETGFGAADNHDRHQSHHHQSRADEARNPERACRVDTSSDTAIRRWHARDSRLGGGGILQRVLRPKVGTARRRHQNETARSDRAQGTRGRTAPRGASAASEHCPPRRRAANQRP